ncbi:phosphatidate cytidylyltransferase [Candidatus Babeliales bacterium]|nr:phosphatidate cytidylyltransferase [Candidatus Babeliales bacterium]
MNDLGIRVATGTVVAVLFFGCYFLSAKLFASLLLVLLVFILIFEWPKLCATNKKLWLLTPFYPVFPVIALLDLQLIYRPIDILLPLYPFFIAAAADTGGYFVGILIGKHKMLPRVSPKKTWEGLAGSFLFVLITNFILTTYRPAFVTVGLTNNWLRLIIASLVLTLVASAGDLFESYLKRRAGLKDTGSILPGHGGLLDRFDAVFFVSVVVWWWLRLLFR